MSTVTAIQGFPTVAAGSEVLGEIVSWYLPPDAEVRFSHLGDALEAAGLDRRVARTFLPRNAFARAAKKLADKRIIRKVTEDETALRFQFTRESNDGVQIDYRFEAILSLDKQTGSISCDDAELASRAKDAFDEATDRRTAGDVTAVVQRLFSDKSQPDLDLIPIRRQGGAYFVRREGLAFVDKVGAFLDQLHGELTRLPIAAGQGRDDAGVGRGEKVVAVSVAERIKGLVEELDEKVEAFDPDPDKNSPQGVKAAAERVKVIRHKIASYAEYLVDQKAALDAALAESVVRLQCKLAGVSGDD